MPDQLLKKPLQQSSKRSRKPFSLVMLRKRYIGSTHVNKTATLRAGKVDLLDLPFDDALREKKQPRSFTFELASSGYSVAKKKVHEPSSHELLEYFRQPQSNVKKLCAYIIESERTSFSQDDQTELALILETFIRTYRDSSEFDVIVAVGSAIRKFVGMTDVRQVGYFASLLESGHNSALSLDMELEIVKMILRKLEANPPEIADPEPELAQQLAQIAQAYINPCVLPKGKHATVAMLALEVLAAMKSLQFTNLLPLVNENCPTWFRKHLRFHLNKSADQLQIDGHSAEWLQGGISEINTA